MQKPSAERLSKIKAFIMDVDGVLTDGMVYTLESGERLRGSNIKDGFALQHALKAGYQLAVISGAANTGMRVRLQGLGVQDVFEAVPHKLPVYEAYLATKALTREQVAYIGDDLPDYEVMQQAGLACAPADAAQDILTIAHYVTRLAGGHGCVRELIELVMRHQGTWLSPQAYHW